MFPLPPPDRAPTPQLENSDPELVYTPRAMYSFTSMIPAYITAPRLQGTMDIKHDFAGPTSSTNFTSSDASSGIGGLSGVGGPSVSSVDDFSAFTGLESSSMKSSQETPKAPTFNRRRGVAITQIHSDSLKQTSAQNPGLDPYMIDTAASSRYPELNKTKDIRLNGVAKEESADKPYFNAKGVLESVKTKNDGESTWMDKVDDQYAVYCRHNPGTVIKLDEFRRAVSLGGASAPEKAFRVKNLLMPGTKIPDVVEDEKKEEKDPIPALGHTRTFSSVLYPSDPPAAPSPNTAKKRLIKLLEMVGIFENDEDVQDGEEVGEEACEKVEGEGGALLLNAAAPTFNPTQPATNLSESLYTPFSVVKDFPYGPMPVPGNVGSYIPMPIQPHPGYNYFPGGLPTSHTVIPSFAPSSLPHQPAAFLGHTMAVGANTNSANNNHYVSASRVRYHRSTSAAIRYKQIVAMQMQQHRMGIPVARPLSKLRRAIRREAIYGKPDYNAGTYNKGAAVAAPNVNTAQYK